jgi:hypothetical protein
MTPELEALHAHLATIKATGSAINWQQLLTLLGPVILQLIAALTGGTTTTTPTGTTVNPPAPVAK